MAAKLRVLLVEDESFFQKFYVLKLSERGFDVDLAIDGEEAILKIAKNAYDCVLLDIIMPNKNGFAVLQYAKETGFSTKTPIIMFSTIGQDADMKKALALGAVDYANKAFFDFETLLHKIETVIKNNHTT